MGWEDGDLIRLWDGGVMEAITLENPKSVNSR
jgi:hypothetical protein